MTSRFLAALYMAALSLLTLPVAVIAHDKPASTPTAAAGIAVDPSILALAKEWFYRFQSGHIDRSQFERKLNDELTPAIVENEAAKLKTYRKPVSFRFVRTYPIHMATGYDFVLDFRSGQIIEAIAMYPDHKIAGIDFMDFAGP